MVFGLGCVLLVLVVLFIDEPWYRRDIEPESQPPKSNRLSRILGVWQIGHRSDYFLSPGVAYRRLLSVFLKPVIVQIMIY